LFRSSPIHFVPRSIRSFTILFLELTFVRSRSFRSFGFSFLCHTHVHVPHTVWVLTCNYVPHVRSSPLIRSICPYSFLVDFYRFTRVFLVDSPHLTFLSHVLTTRSATGPHRSRSISGSRLPSFFRSPFTWFVTSFTSTHGSTHHFVSFGFTLQSPHTTIVSVLPPISFCPTRSLVTTTFTHTTPGFFAIFYLRATSSHYHRSTWILRFCLHVLPLPATTFYRSHVHVRCSSFRCSFPFVRYNSLYVAFSPRFVYRFLRCS